ncbi:hypothetical protein [Mycobacterium sp. NAZ190054]|uniref:hypothetical protein n=1 Tax=Mycobacterium sp. NAZ190054 TaxID=1747766 RepID=UPI000792C3AB|nr:hypothetical protein [Mycobacterium sp. NAZ190054]KWX67592.1 hypothetical protein ASJ79_21155 [Mycobacterium sp. NAZ190054]
MTAPRLDLHALEHQLRHDPEFVLNSHQLTATIRVIIGTTQSFQIIVGNGSLTEIDPEVTPFDPYDIQLAGTDEHWTQLLAVIPPAFYQDFYPAMVHHGFRIEGDMETIMAYYPAIRRLGDLLRTVAAREVAA